MTCKGRDPFSLPLLTLPAGAARSKVKRALSRPIKEQHMDYSKSGGVKPQKDSQKSFGQGRRGGPVKQDQSDKKAELLARMKAAAEAKKSEG